MRIGVRRSQPACRAGQQELVVITRQRRDRKTQRRKAPYFHGGQGPLDLLRRLAPPRPVLKIEPDLSRIFFLEPERFQDDGDSLQDNLIHALRRRRHSS